MADQVSHALTLILDIKSPENYTALKALINQMQSAPPTQNPINVALNKIGTVHFARFVFLSQEQLGVITTFDGDFDEYLTSFVNDIGAVFDKLLAHVKDAPPLPVQQHPEAFSKFVKANNRPCEGTLYSAYPEWSVQDLLTLIKKQQSAS
jgi:hypothetical protein